MTNRLISFGILFSILSRKILCAVMSWNIHYLVSLLSLITVSLFVATQYISKYNLQLEDSNDKSPHFIYKLLCGIKNPIFYYQFVNQFF